MLLVNRERGLTCGLGGEERKESIWHARRNDLAVRKASAKLDILGCIELRTVDTEEKMERAPPHLT